MFKFEITSRLDKTRSRTGIFHTPHHQLETPEYAIVATDAEFRAVPGKLWQELDCKFLIVNTYHTYTKGLITKIDQVQGLHNYMNLKDKTIATDSGGFQIFSLGFGQKHNVGKLAKSIGNKKDLRTDDASPLEISDEEVSFVYDGKTVKFGPEKSIDLQHRLGADIIFAFDECTSPINSKEYTRRSMERTHEWLDRCIGAHENHRDKQALFGIIQGGEYQDLREESARIVGSKDVQGFGIGGSFGTFKENLSTVVAWVTSKLPEEKPRHLLGVGQVRDVFEAVQHGVDLFDCVIPTREARHGMVYTKNGRLPLRKMKHLTEVIEKECGCLSCRERVKFSQIWQMFVEKDPRGPMYATVHNIQFFTDLMKNIRLAIAKNKLLDLKDRYYKFY
ncbi:hypothetical protein A3A93_03040 [Candidatus Roizmanbacteria bacterium RIFCSPLOWO2_01_FULL_38_12]|uniref:tRNA-guanine(15) transglycosylase-like domain-containing protein n=1 Tax=Candidatus Roizmanbacteria bacterium RIFCSPLOWO2_01_FULL_38_12 TaxID=1802061 RepID=A0A1F7IZJ2_9BACT|nr:MAG: hypothetical protein A2861_02795 [Candidatus Roizmanbacteria bacterium RIFCSPHIGHO2_01_FULL_38_15]OGK35366.1 MAG: hypothetical protein A3F59_06170 [Candidatus Roizmanbacteria bacterium RIFCSPHIGHO2_12_FULL_38_13]OGK48774.1 MAG: hypothetical protein A3A93_03040 [Candidatus Roizmanbacteria bacterium RIFCSPLOWO2_01_FULL_38_12]